MPENTEYTVALQQFETYYAQTVFPALQKVEARRKKSLAVFCLIVPFVFAWLAFVAYQVMQRLSNQEYIDLSQYGLITCLAILLACLPMFGYYRKSKESLLPLLAGFFGEFSYAWQPQIPDKLLQQSKIMKKYDRIASGDSFSGIYDGVPVSITEYAMYRRRSEGGKSAVTYARFGGGIIFYARMNKKFSGQTIVVRDKGWLNKLAHYKNMQWVGLESPVFEKAFEAYSDSQVEARYILTAAMLEYMAALKKQFPKIEFSFFQEHLFINIQTVKNQFECTGFFTSVLNKKRIERSFKELFLLFSIIRIMRLNQQAIL